MKLLSCSEAALLSWGAAKSHAHNIKRRSPLSRGCKGRAQLLRRAAIALDSLDLAEQTVDFQEAANDDSRAVAMLQWLEEKGARQDRVTVREVVREGNHLDVSVAKVDLKEGDVAFSLPEDLIITLNRVFEDEAVAELLTTNKLSELACLTLYVMYEKKLGRSSVWHEYLRELDRFQARGQSGAKSPLLWDEGQVEELLCGSPVVKEIQDRLQGIDAEYEELDTVWYMAGSLFTSYPYSVPSETFPLSLFRQAFAAVQASVVHLQGVELARRFALVPLGPPILSYSPTSKATIKYDASKREVQLIADRDYQAGEAIYAWCGPQPNRRLLLNYGIVDDQNPYDRVSLCVTLPNCDPLYQAKRALLQPHSLSTQQVFQLQRDKGLPEKLLPYLRLAHCTDAASLEAIGRSKDLAEVGPLTEANEMTVLCQLGLYLEDRLSRYRTSIEEDDAVVESESAGPRQKIAARLLRIEKRILQEVLREVKTVRGAEKAMGFTCEQGCAVVAVRLSS